MAKTDKLIEGYKAFHQEYFGEETSLYAGMKEGQPAKILMIACCDSRVDPAIVTNCDPGELFIIRNVANLVPPYEADNAYHGTSAAIEYAVNHLEVETIIVMGHANCGGIKALWQDGSVSETQFIEPWISIAGAAKEKVKHEHKHDDESTQLTACEQTSVVSSLDNLMTFPFIKKRTEEGSLKLHGWYFDVRSGDLMAYKRDQDKFASVREQ